jgi:hypothetical protein
MCGPSLTEDFMPLTVGAIGHRFVNRRFGSSIQYLISLSSLLLHTRGVEIVSDLYLIVNVLSTKSISNDNFQ